MMWILSTCVPVSTIITVITLPHSYTLTVTLIPYKAEIVCTPYILVFYFGEYETRIARVSYAFQTFNKYFEDLFDFKSEKYIFY